MSLLSGPLNFAILLMSLSPGNSLAQSEDPLPIADAHVHYSHDSVEMTPPERIHIIPLHAEQALYWLASLPEDIAERVAWKNAFDLIMPLWNANRAASCDHEDAEFVLDSKGLSVSIRTMAPSTSVSPSRSW